MDTPIAKSPPKEKPEKNAYGDPRFPQSGAILIDKPEGITSSDVVFKLKKALSAGKRLPWGFKIGHGGTLDPFATGLMVVFFGEATKLSNAYLRSRKSYTGRMRLGVQTDTADLTGKPVAEAAVPVLSLADWQAHADTFVDHAYHQTPPMYSAKRVDGMHLYHIAREGREVDREALLKEIHEFQLSQPSPPDLNFKVECESGTYVRTIAEDLAKKAGTHAHLLSLRRTSSSDLNLARSATLESAAELLAGKDDPAGFDFVLRVEQVARHLPFVAITARDEEQMRRGNSQVTQHLINRFQSEFEDFGYGLLRAEDGYPVGLIHELRLQRILNRLTAAG